MIRIVNLFHAVSHYFGSHATAEKLQAGDMTTRKSGRELKRCDASWISRLSHPLQTFFSLQMSSLYNRALEAIQTAIGSIRAGPIVSGGSSSSCLGFINVKTESIAFTLTGHGHLAGIQQAQVGNCCASCCRDHGSQYLFFLVQVTAWSTSTSAQPEETLSQLMRIAVRAFSGQEGACHSCD
jgi:hypothetical protein